MDGRDSPAPVRTGGLFVNDESRDTLPLTPDNIQTDTQVQLSEGELGPVADLLELARQEQRYTRDALLGEGGMGAVWLVVDPRIGRRVALKALPSERVESREAVGRFVREARVQGQLEHPAVVPVYDLGVDDQGAVYFTMKRVRGVTLEEILDQLRADLPEAARRWSRRRLLQAFNQVGLAVDFAHQHGVLHRDLKPANIMLGDFGEVYLLDWGVAKVLSEDGSNAAVPRIDVGELESLATQGQLLGTPHFMSPEHLTNAPGASQPTVDVYGLGAILFELLTLEPLKTGETVGAVLAETFQGVDARPSVRAPGREVPPELEAICVQATAQDPGERFPSARAMVDAVERYLDGERNQELRKEMAQQAATSAQEAVARVKQDRHPSLQQHRDAMRDVGRALALDPDNEQALDTFMDLLSHPPDETPPEVTHALQISQERQWRWTGRVAGVAYLSLVLYLPLFFWSGIRSTWEVAGFFGCAALSGIIALVTGFSRKPRIQLVLACMVTSTLCYAFATAFFGPLFLVPALMATNTAAFTILLRGGYRVLTIVFSCVVLYGLILGDLLELWGSHYAFSDHGMLIRPGAIDLPLGPTVAMLRVAALATILTSALSVSRVRDALHTAEKKVNLQAWQIRQLLPAFRPVRTSPWTSMPTGRSATQR